MLYFLLDMSCGECNVIALYVLCFSVNVFFALCIEGLAVFVNCLVQPFAIYSGVVVVVECY